MNRRQKIIVSVTGIFLVLLLLVGLTYAYFLTKINGNENSKSISISTANLALVYGDGNGIITGSNIMPGTTLDKKEFTVKNEGDDTTDYVVVIEDVKVTNVSNGLTTTFESNDFVYTLKCTSDGEDCTGVDTEVTFPITGGIVVGNSIEVGKTHTYELIVTYKETGVDQSNDMNKKLEAKVNIADPNGFNPYIGDKGSLAYNIINNAIALSNEEKSNGYAELRSTPLTKPAEESTMIFADGVVGPEKTRSYSSKTTLSETNAARFYFTYGDTATYTTNYTITNKDGSALQAVLLSTGYETLKGKYIVSYSGSTSSTPVSGSGQYSIFYVTNATATTIEYMTIDSGLAANEKYITYSESYKFNQNTGLYSLKDPKVIKYKDGYETLKGKYIVSTYGSTSSTASNSTNVSVIYQVTGNSTETQMAYKAITKKTTTDSYGNAENTLSMTPDEYGTSYYYRGGVKNNYLNFNGMCWRIVRIEGDGSIKIVLADATAECSNDTLSKTESAFIGTGDYGYDSSYKADYENSQNRTTSMKYKLNVFLNGGSFSNSIWDQNTSSYVSETVTYSAWSAEAKSKLKTSSICIGDTTTQYAANDNGEYFYETYVRLNGKGQTASATLICNANGGKTSETQIFPLTADEVVFAGGKASVSNYTYYLRENSLNDWYTLSVHGYANVIAADEAFRVSSSGGLGPHIVKYQWEDYSGDYGELYLRPAVSLISGTQFESGDGSISSPYTIK